LLIALDRPDIPLDTNSAENDIRCQVIRRKISGGTRSDAGRTAATPSSASPRPVQARLLVLDYLGARLAVTALLFLTYPNSSPNPARQPDPPGALSLLPSERLSYVANLCDRSPRFPPISNRSQKIPQHGCDMRCPPQRIENSSCEGRRLELSSVQRDVDSLMYSEAMDRVADYINRGRIHAGLSDDELLQKWTKATNKLADDVTLATVGYAKFCLDAEMDLRNLNPTGDEATQAINRMGAAVSQFHKQYPGASQRMEEDLNDKLAEYKARIRS
jgi:hypothetical protein